MDASAIKAADAKVRETVEGILEQVETRRDAAVRELSQKFDNWSPPSFKLTAPEIERAIAQVSQRDLDDTVRAAKCATSREAEGHLARPRSNCPARLGHCNIPVARSAAMCRAGAIHGRLAHMSIVTHGSPGKRIAACAPPFGRAALAIVAAMHFGGADDIYVSAAQAVAAMALGADHWRGRHDRRPRQRLCGGAKRRCWPRRHRPACGPTETLIIADDSGPGNVCDRPAGLPSRPDLAAILLTNSEDSRATPWPR
jgi:sulfopropanediol 3-dehydrogenase